MMLRTRTRMPYMTRTKLRHLLATAPTGLVALAAPATSSASMFKGETLDAVANGIAWVVLIVVPVVLIAVFWLVHILPEKIAEKKKHPQAKAIQVLCLLSLVFGGMLWPLAWLWAYSKPVLYKMAYGTDVDEAHHGASSAPPESAANPDAARREIDELRAQLASLEARLGQEARG
jgi:CBS domain containing-hemolysin-like protein